MNLPLWIARHTASQRGSAQRTMIRIATIATAVGVAVMILTMAVVAGFRQEIVRVMSGVAADVVVADVRLFSSHGQVFKDSASLRQLIATQEGVRSVNGYATIGGVIRSDFSAAGVLLRGVDSLYDSSVMNGEIVEGKFPSLAGNRRREVLLSSVAAEELRVAVGDKVELLFMLEDSSMRRDVFKVCGIEGTSLGESAAYVAITDIRNIQRVLGEGCVSGYEIRIDNIDRADAIADTINTALLYANDGDEQIVAFPAKELYPEVFAWLGTHDVNAAVIIAIMLTVALFNILTALLIMVLERTRMIGILKSLGMDNRAVAQIFVSRATIAATKGVVVGTIAGLGLALAQKWGHFIHLDAQGYMLSQVPIAIDWWVVATIGIGTIAVVAAVASVVTFVIGRIEPTTALRYE